MALEHSIIHRLSRSSDTASISTQLNDSAHSEENAALSLFEQLRRVSGPSALRQVGQFDPERSDNPFPKLLDDLYEEKLPLTRVSEKLVKHLGHALDSYPEPFEAHLLFALDSSVNQKTLYIFWVEHQEALHITQALSLEDVHYIEPRNLVAAVTINLSDYRDLPDEKYLSLYISRGYKELGDCLEFFTAFTSDVNTAAETEAFLDIVEQYTSTLPEEETQSKRNDILDYCIEQNMAGEPVHIDVLSCVVNGDEPEAFTHFVSQHQENPKKSIYTHRPSLKRYGRLSGRDKDISLSFSADLIGESIEFDAQDNALIIRHLPKGLKEQLVQAMGKAAEQTSSKAPD